MTETSPQVPGSTRKGEIKRQTVWLVAGGTAGHLHAAIAVADALAERAEVVLITSDRAIDAVVIAETSYRSVVIRGVGVGHGPRAIARAIVGNASSLGANCAVLARLPRPSVAVSFGGFHTPLVVGFARVLGARVVLMEQNAVVGRANRITGVLAERVLCALPTTLPHRWYSRALMTGNPLRSGVKSYARDLDPRGRARRELGIPSDALVSVITTGSLGARRVNEVIDEMVTKGVFGDRCYHFVGTLNQTSSGLSAKGYYPLSFVSDMYRYLAAADLVIARSGASTIAEIAAFGRASILVPLPNAPKDHQMRNAELLSRVGAAVVLSEDDLSAERLRAEAMAILGDDGRRHAMERAAASLARLDAASAVAREVMNGVDR
ncbi:MAG: UDP-N-acetylglucosamine--N-acetylmuramyl-(pentapeptide) pyrophosphoryl-undecaprenol N-acetylglucosamine transferase [Ferrimicrobium sp.]